jgi:hypothetical protein
MAPSKKKKAAKVAKSTSAIVPKMQDELRPKRVQPEKRARIYEIAPDSDLKKRISRALSQRMFLVGQIDKSNTRNGQSRMYDILGSTGNVYNIEIKKLPSCTCPDFERGHLCKHIIFVMAKVLHVSRRSDLIYQRALLKTELAKIFADAPTAPLSEVLANTKAIAAYNNVVGGLAVPCAPEKDPDGDCPVCYETLICNKKMLDSCGTCRNYIHKECLGQWLSVQRNCVYCRAVWCAYGTKPLSAKAKAKAAAAAGGEEGYINLGAEQGLNRRRDTYDYEEFNLWN